MNKKYSISATAAEFNRELIKLFENNLSQYEQDDTEGTWLERRLNKIYQVIEKCKLVTPEIRDNYWNAILKKKERRVIRFDFRRKHTYYCNYKCELTFKDRRLIKINRRCKSVVEQLHSIFERRKKEEELVSLRSDIKQQLIQYKQFVNDAKNNDEDIRALFANRSNWLLLKQLVALDALTDRFDPVRFYYVYFPFSDESNQTFDFFLDIYRHHATVHYRNIDTLLVRTYPHSRYFWYILKDQWKEHERDIQLFVLFVHQNLSQFPFNPSNFYYLISLIESASVEDKNVERKDKMLRYIFMCIGRNIPEDCSCEDYACMVNCMCKLLGLPPSPTFDQIIAYAKSKGFYKTWPCYGNFLETFYAGGYCQPSVKDVGVTIHNCIRRGKKLKSTYTTALRVMLESLLKRQPDAVLKLKLQHTYDSQFMTWLNKISTLLPSNLPFIDSSEHMIPCRCECSKPAVIERSIIRLMDLAAFTK